MADSKPDAISQLLRRILPRQYVAGNVYNGVTLSITGTNGFLLSRGLLVPYRTFQTSLGGDAGWRLVINFQGTTNNVKTPTFTISGVIFETAFANQSLSCSVNSNNSNHAVTSGGTANILGFTQANATNWRISGDVALDSRPTWMDR